MKSKLPNTRRSARVLAGSIAAMLAVQSAQAALRVWDAGGANADHGNTAVSGGTFADTRAGTSTGNANGATN